MVARGTWLALVWLSACGEPATPTQVMVRIDPDDGVRGDLTDVRVVVNVPGEDGEQWLRVFDQAGDQTELQWPLEVAVVPARGDSARVFEVVATALDGEQVLVSRRAVSSFENNRLRLLQLRLEDVCRARRASGQLCSGDDDSCHGDGCETCVAGGCVPSGQVELVAYSPAPGSKDPGPADPGDTPADEMDAGGPPADDQDAGADAATEAGVVDMPVVPDAGEPPVDGAMPDPGPACQPVEAPVCSGDGQQVCFGAEDGEPCDCRAPTCGDVLAEPVCTATDFCGGVDECGALCDCQPLACESQATPVQCDDALAYFGSDQCGNACEPQPRCDTTTPACSPGGEYCAGTDLCTGELCGCEPEACEPDSPACDDTSVYAGRGECTGELCDPTPLTCEGALDCRGGTDYCKQDDCGRNCGCEPEPCDSEPDAVACQGSTTYFGRTRCSGALCDGRAQQCNEVCENADQDPALEVCSYDECGDSCGSCRTPACDTTPRSCRTNPDNGQSQRCGVDECGQTCGCLANECIPVPLYCVGGFGYRGVMTCTNAPCDQAGFCQGEPL